MSASPPSPPKSRSVSGNHSQGPVFDSYGCVLQINPRRIGKARQVFSHAVPRHRSTGKSEEKGLGAGNPPAVGWADPQAPAAARPQRYQAPEGYGSPSSRQRPRESGHAARPPPWGSSPALVQSPGQAAPARPRLPLCSQLPAAGQRRDGVLSTGPSYPRGRAAARGSCQEVPRKRLSELASSRLMGESLSSITQVSPNGAVNPKRCRG